MLCSFEVFLNKTLLIIGAGGHGKSVAEAALLSGHWQAVLFVDDRWPQAREAFGCQIVADVAGLANVAHLAQGAVVAVGSNTLRKTWFEALASAGLPQATVIHPQACVSASAQIGPGSVVMALAVVGVDVHVGAGAIINAGTVVDHDAVVEDFVHLGVGVSIAGGVRIESSAWLQAGCSAGYGVVVKRNTVFAPGTALTAKD
ncbi:acetyltransferase [Pseudomonas sp. RC2C2]|nr:acetyltransferase [Pseudomonas sp. RC2C2]